MENVRGFDSQSYHDPVLQAELCIIATTNILDSFVHVWAEVLLLGVPN